jgi:apolipoprotein D and lipocalin family protein
MKSVISLMLLVALLAGCRAHPPLRPVEQVDVPRFMGRWYVIACIPTRLERNAYDEVESYRLAPDGRVLTELNYRAGSFDNPQRRHTAVGYVVPGSRGAVWGMQFIWPFRADYRITYLDAQYSQTIIAREKRDYVWIMARTPRIAEDAYEHLTAEVAAQGYDPTRLRRVPQREP